MAKKVGEVIHYYNNIGVAILKIESELKIGDKVDFSGHTTDFSQEIKEIQIDHKPVSVAKRGAEVGVKVDEHVREGDGVYFDE